MGTCQQALMYFKEFAGWLVVAAVNNLKRR
jgi:hypothetical protein